jgi:hypothetical protein
MNSFNNFKDYNFIILSDWTHGTWPTLKIWNNCYTNHYTDLIFHKFKNINDLLSLYNECIKIENGKQQFFSINNNEAFIEGSKIGVDFSMDLASYKSYHFQIEFKDFLLFLKHFVNLIESYATLKIENYASTNHYKFNNEYEISNVKNSVWYDLVLIYEEYDKLPRPMLMLTSNVELNDYFYNDFENLKSTEQNLFSLLMVLNFESKVKLIRKSDYSIAFKHDYTYFYFKNELTSQIPSTLFYNIYEDWCNFLKYFAKNKFPKLKNLN